MNYCKRAFLSVWKRKGKNLLLVVVFCIIATLMLACISIRTAATKAENDAKTKLGSSVTVEPDWSKAPTQTFSNGNSAATAPPITKDMIERLGKIPHVKYINYKTGTVGQASGFKVVCNEEMEQKVVDDLESQGYANTNISVTGVKDTSSLDEFTSGEDKLTSGRQINKDDDGKDITMIEVALADKNGLKVGDKIKLLCVGTDGKLCGRSIELTIVGIFKAPAATGIKAMFTLGNPSDTIFTPLSVPGEMDTTSEINEATCYLDSPESIDYFKSEATKIPGMDKFKLEANDETTYQQMTGPLQNVAGFTNSMIIFIMLASCLILCLIAVLSVKNRGQEFGILLAVGEKKRKIIAQVTLEALLPMLIAVCLAIPFGSIIAQGMGSSLLNGQVHSAQQQNQNNGDGITKNANGAYVFSGGTNDESSKNAKPIDSINVTPAPNNYGKLALLCLLIVAASAAVPAVSIYRRNPRDILIKNE